MKRESLDWLLFVISCLLLVALTPFSHADDQKLASEPHYCSVQYFSKAEIYSFKNNNSLVRARGFKLGQSVLLGVAVGKSDVDELVKLSDSYNQGQEIGSKKYCTWYLHTPSMNPIDFFNSILAMQTFNYTPIERNPRDLSSTEAVSEVMQAVQSSFFDRDPSFVSCLVKNKYLAVGCQGMRHRGPTVIGAILAFSGCTPQTSAEIVNRLWGLNDVAPEVRLAVIEAAYVYGLMNPKVSKELSMVFSQSQ
jgi:hypothetical protein